MKNKIISLLLIATTIFVGCGQSQNSGASDTEALQEDDASAEDTELNVTRQTFEHHYELQEDSYESTDTTGGYRHYICADCGDEYSYETDPLVYEINPKTGEVVDQANAYNPLLPDWEHIPDGEPQVYWSKEDEEWRVYLYGSHDVDGTTYCGPNYTLWSAPVYDLSDWRNEGIIEDISEGSTFGAMNLFAPDSAYDLQTDTYYLISNEFLGYSVLRASDNPAGPFNENEALWYISVKGCYDPSIYIEDGTIYIAGSCMKNYYSELEIGETVAADNYKSGMSQIGVIYQLEDNLEAVEDFEDGDGIAQISWMPNEERDYLPIYEGPSLVGWVEEANAYIYLYVSNDVGADGTSYNSVISYMYTDDIMNGTWHYGENAVDEIYPEVDELISGNHGNAISDLSGRYVKDIETGEISFNDFPTIYHGNNHGSIAKVNGTWYFFGHRHTGQSPNNRQAIAGEITVSFNDDIPVITPMEYTSSGIAGSIDAGDTIDAYRACILLEATDHQAPAAEDNPHSDCVENTPYINVNRSEGAENASYITNITDGSVVGFKYIDFDNISVSSLSFLLGEADNSSEGTVELWIDGMSSEDGGTLVGETDISAAMIQQATNQEDASDGRSFGWIDMPIEKDISGIHAIFLIFHSNEAEQICDLSKLKFE